MSAAVLHVFSPLMVRAVSDNGRVMTINGMILRLEEFEL